MSIRTGQFVSYEVAFRLRASTPELFARMLEVLPFGTMPSFEQGCTATEFTLNGDTPDEIADLRRDLMVHVADFAPGFVFLHAGVVAHGGRAIVLPGASFAGKTTLTAALVRAGATYYSDEYAVLGPDGAIHPYARALQVRTPGFDDQQPVPVEQLDGVAGADRVRAGLIAFIEYVPGASWAPRAVTPGLAILEMLRHSIPVQRTPARVLATLHRFADGARLMASERDGADAAAQALLSLLAESAV